MGELLEWLIEWLTILAQVIVAIRTLLEGAKALFFLFKKTDDGEISPTPAGEASS